MEDLPDMTHAILAASEWAIRLRVPTFNNENVEPAGDRVYVPDPRLPLETDPDLQRLPNVRYDVRVAYKLPMVVITGIFYGQVKNVNIINLSNGVEQAQGAEARMLHLLQERYGDIPPPSPNASDAPQNFQTSIFPLQPFSTLGLANAYANMEAPLSLETPETPETPGSELDLSSLTLSESEDEEEEEEDAVATNGGESKRIVFGSLHNMNKRDY